MGSVIGAGVWTTWRTEVGSEEVEGYTMFIPRQISVVVPVYNSAATLETLAKRVDAALATMATDFELVLVNDGSRDESWQMIESLARQHTFILGINLMRNFGQHNALLAGVRAARFPIVVTIDDDLQHPPEEIPLLLAQLERGYDVVYGTPAHLPHTPWRNLTSRLMKRFMAGIIGVKNARQISAFRAFRTDLRKAFETYQSPDVFLDVLLSWGTTRFSWVKVRHDPRAVGTSNYTFTKLVRQATMLLTGYSTKPLRLATFVGFGFTCFGIAVLCYVVARALLQGSIPGFPFLASIIAIFSGAQLFALGIIGEYLAVTHNRLMDRPVYIVRESVHAPTAPAPAELSEPEYVASQGARR